MVLLEAYAAGISSISTLVLALVLALVLVIALAAAHGPLLIAAAHGPLSFSPQLIIRERC